MTVLATADATTVTRPAPARSGSPGRTRGTPLRSVPSAPEVSPESPEQGAEPATVHTAEQPRQGTATRIAKPPSRSAKPVSRSAEPVSRSAEPVSRSAEPVSRSAEPVSRSAEPVSRSAELMSGGADPISRDADPISRDADPISRDADPISRDAELISRGAELVSGGMEPVSRDAEPEVRGNDRVGPPPLGSATGSEPVTLTIRIEGGGRAGRDRLLTALRDLVAAAGPGAAVLFAAEAGDIRATPARLGGGASLRSVAALNGPGFDGQEPGEPESGAIRLEPRPRTVARDGWPLHLSRLEYDLLLFLARHPRQVFSRSQLLAQVWGHTHTTNRTVDVHVSRLRNKLGDQDLVTTVYGLGYRLADDAPVTVAE
jgi:two-component system response regulator MtrA